MNARDRKEQARIADQILAAIPPGVYLYNLVAVLSDILHTNANRLVEAGETCETEISAERDRIVRLLTDARGLTDDYRVADLLTALAACVRNPALTIGDAYRTERNDQIKRRGY